MELTAPRSTKGSRRGHGTRKISERMRRFRTWAPKKRGRIFRKREEKEREGGGKLRIHPLFLLAGILSGFTGGLLVFLSAVLCALEHECAHALKARSYGYTLNKVVLMPYGAVIAGDLAGIGKREELAVLAAGPLCNLATGFLFVALWWLYPETYPYTELAAAMSFSLFLVNLLPAYPLDGGRILRVLLSPLGKDRAKKISVACTLLTGLALLVGFVFTLRESPNFSLLFFAIFLLCSFGGGEYERISFSRKQNFARGIEERRVALSADLPLGKAVRYLREDRYLTLLLFDGEEFLCEMSEEELFSALEGGDYADPLKKYAGRTL